MNSTPVYVTVVLLKYYYTEYGIFYGIFTCEVPVHSAAALRGPRPATKCKRSRCNGIQILRRVPNNSGDRYTTSSLLRLHSTLEYVGPT